MTDWSNERIMEFIECYQNEPILWDQRLKDHKDRKKVNDAWIRISEELNISVVDLKRKKDTLMATFRGHWRKKKASIKSAAGTDEIYKPIWFAYEAMEHFLSPVYANNHTGKSDNQTVFLEEATNDEDGVEDPLEIASPLSPTTTTTLLGPTQRRQRYNASGELQDAIGQMKEAFSTLNSALNKERREEDECDLFGKLLALKLRKLPQHERMLFMYEIDGMFINKVQRLSDPPIVENTPNRPSSSQSVYSDSLPLSVNICTHPPSFSGSSAEQFSATTYGFKRRPTSAQASYPVEKVAKVSSGHPSSPSSTSRVDAISNEILSPQSQSIVNIQGMKTDDNE